MSAVQSMNKERFWELIDDARQATDDWKSMFEPLMDRLSGLDEQDIVRWGHIFDEYLALSYKDKLYAAAYVMQNGCSYDSFDYFRGWLIAQGKDVYFKALAEPESLVNVQSVKILAREVNASECAPMRGYTNSARFEIILSAASEAYGRKYPRRFDQDDQSENEYSTVAEKFRLTKKEKVVIADDITYADDIDVKWVGSRSFFEKDEDKGKITVDELLPTLYKIFNGGDIDSNSTLSNVSPEGVSTGTNDLTEVFLEIECTRQSIIKSVNATIDRTIMLLENKNNLHNQRDYKSVVGDAPAVTGNVVPITINPAIFVRKKPVAVMIADKCTSVKSWREVMSTVLYQCCQDPVYYERLMDLRGKASGNFRIFLASKPDGMTKPVKIVEGLYVEAHHGAQGMMYALTNKVLAPINYDCAQINIYIR